MQPPERPPRLVTCPACGVKVSYYADACPECGEPTPRSGSPEQEQYQKEYSEWWERYWKPELEAKQKREEEKRKQEEYYRELEESRKRHARFLRSLFIVIIIVVIGVALWPSLKQHLKDMEVARQEAIAEHQKAIAVQKQEKERNIANLYSWLDKWFQKNLPSAEKIGYKPYFYFDYQKIDTDIYVTGGATFQPVKHSGLCTMNFVFHSPDNGINWEILWKKPDDWIGIGPKRIQIVDKQRICVQLNVGGFPPSTWMLYTNNGGKNWGVHSEWNPSIVK